MTSTLRAGLIGAGIGSASMFLLDPDRGARRRALIRDKAVWATRKTRDAAGATSRDVNNRLSGLRARARARHADETVDDATLVARVRAALGRVTSHPRAITVTASNGVVTLTGDALKREADAITAAVASVRGVTRVQNEIRSHASAQAIPALQGGSLRPGQWSGWIRGGWSPAALLCAAASVATGAIALAAARSGGNGHTYRDDDLAIDTGNVAIVTEIGILDATPSEPGAYGRTEYYS